MVLVISWNMGREVFVWDVAGEEVCVGGSVCVGSGVSGGIAD